MRTSSRATAILLFEEFELLDVGGPLQVLTMAGRSWNFRPFKVFLVSARPGLVASRSQLRVEATHALAECPRPEIVIVPGGYGARRAVLDAALVEWLRGASDSATHVVGIGNGVLPLAKAGALDGAEVSVSAELVTSLAELAPSAHPDPQARFRESGKVFTAATAQGATELALLMVERQIGKKQAESVAVALGIPWTVGAGKSVRIVE